MQIAAYRQNSRPTAHLAPASRYAFKVFLWVCFYAATWFVVVPTLVTGLADYVRRDCLADVAVCQASVDRYR